MLRKHLNVATLESYGLPGFRGLLDGASQGRQKGGHLRGKEDKRRKEDFEVFISF